MCITCWWGEIPGRASSITISSVHTHSPSQHSQAAAAARLPPPLAAQLPAARSIKGLQQQVAGLHDEVVKRVAAELSLYKCNKALRCVSWRWMSIETDGVRAL